jgi:diguanylate cyclase (GGDEF)-like protein
MRIVHAVVLASTVGVGLWWLKRPWPGYRSAIAFVVWADLAVVIAAIVLSAPQSRLCATIHMGLIGVFKQLNDNHGHSIGDAALRGIGEQLLAMIRPTDIAARIGGDEFVLITYLEDGDGLHSFIDRCDDLLLHTSAEAVVSTSIGIAWQTSEDAHFSLDDVLKNADAAMYEAKRGGGNDLIVQSAYRSRPRSLAIFCAPGAATARHAAVSARFISPANSSGHSTGVKCPTPSTVSRLTLVKN